ncbi:hypothetical protein D3C72_2348710 [compost metagenome]
MARGNRLDAFHFGNDLGRGFLVFKVRATGQDARAVGAADDDVDVLFCRGRHQSLQRTLMVEQGVAPGQQEGVRLRFA